MFGQGIFTDALTELIRGLKADGIWDKTELICVVRGSEIASLTSLKNSADVGNNVSCAFTPYRGFTTSRVLYHYVDSNKIFGGTMSANSSHLWAYVSNITPPPVISYQSGIVGVITDIPSVADIRIVMVNSTPDIQQALNGSNGTSINADISGGFFGVARDSSTSMTFRVNATETTSAVANTYTILPSAPSLVGAYRLPEGVSSDVLDCHIQGWGWGSGLNAAELSNLRTRIQTYMTAIGAPA